MQAHTSIGADMLGGTASGCSPSRATSRSRTTSAGTAAATPPASGRGIPLAGRIVALADVFDALPTPAPTSRRGPCPTPSRRSSGPAARSSTRSSSRRSPSWITTPSCRPPGDGPDPCRAAPPRRRARAGRRAVVGHRPLAELRRRLLARAQARGRLAGTGRQAGLGRAAGVRPRAGDRAGQRARPPWRWGGGDRGRAADRDAGGALRGDRQRHARDARAALRVEGTRRAARRLRLRAQAPAQGAGAQRRALRA